VSLGYEEVSDPSLFVRFRSRRELNTSFLAWTTTPWTLPSNVALAVGPDIDYVKVRLSGGQGDGEYFVLAAARIEALKAEHEVVATCKGRDLIGSLYEPLFRVDPKCNENACWRVVGADFVSTEDGTGIVHIAPAFGADDYAISVREDLPLVNPIEPDGRFNAATPLVGGLWFKDADKKVARDLRQRGLLFRQEAYLHNYPHDWRKGTPLMSYPVEGWFIRTTALKDKLVALNRTINWYPPSMREGRFGDWLENNVDWALSRKRYWGTPLPVWMSDAPGSGHFEVIGSIAELREKCGDRLPRDAELDLHRPFVDALTWQAADGGTMRRVPDVIDVWFDSGAMPFAQWHYPFENRERFEQSFPADFICEGLDQTRGWFYTLHAIATLVKDSVAFRNVIVNGLILDAKGEKMSKSKGNTVDPIAMIEKHGADVLRWYLLSNSHPWDNMKFSERGLTDTRRKFFNTLENSYAFMASYANIDGFAYEERRVPVSERTELDRWILSRMNTVVIAVDTAFAQYDPTDAVRAVEGFIDEFSNWYIRRSRPRFWKEKKSRSQAAVSDHDKICAYQTTYECLVTVAKLMSPAAPFFGEWLYRALNGATGLEPHASVHTSGFPVAVTADIDPALEHRMALARSIVTLTLLLRNQHRINVRRPLSRLLVATGAGVERAAIEQVRTIILDEVNVQSLECIDDSSGVVRRTAKPNFAKLGPRLGKRMGKAAALIRAWSNRDIGDFLSSAGASLLIDGEVIAIDKDDVEIVSEQVGDWAVAQEGPVTVALDTRITEELRVQGLAREVVNRIQSLRKSAALNLTDRIEVQYACGDALREAIKAHRDWIQGETLALKLICVEAPHGEFSEDFDIDGAPLRVAITRCHTGIVK
jgi:isoleucyl-tRNA synthetase